ncbi:hypothetical protein JW979_16155, partial [bacterium]|nr:hypothetical protein [candidate division CSSED10-310 bacterium]
LFIETGQKQSVRSLATLIRNHLFKMHSDISTSFSIFRKKWQIRSATIGNRLTILDNGSSFEGIDRGIDDEGCLIIDTADGMKSFCTGDIVELGG